jgi:hypothetical protein
MPALRILTEDGWVNVKGEPGLTEVEVAAAVDANPTIAYTNPGTAGAVGDVLTVGPSGPAWYRGERVSLLHPRFGVTGDGVTDDTAAIQAAFDTGLPLFVPEATYKITATLKTKRYANIVGAGRDSNFVASGVTGPVILTYPGTGETYADYQYLAGFNISGTATCAVAFAHFRNSTAERITLNGFTGTDGFVFEYLWGCRFPSLSTEDATISRACFKINKTVLDSLWDVPYTSNFCDFNFYIDANVQEYSTGTGAGFGKLCFQIPTAQGAEVAGFCIRNTGIGSVTIANMYMENVYIPVIIQGDAVMGAWSIALRDCDLIPNAGAPFSLFAHKVGAMTIAGGIVGQTEPVVFGGTSGQVTINGLHRTGNLPLWPLIHRTSDTPSNMPLSILPQNDASTTQWSTLILKHKGYGWGFYEMAVDGAGAWAATAKSPVLADWKPAALTASGTTVTATVTAHGYTTGDSVRIEGASPKAYNGTRTITVTGANTFTYTAATAPGVSPAIGIPLVKK